MIKLLRRLFAPKPKREQLVFVAYDEAERLLKDPSWRVAPEEDNNRVPLMVYLERMPR